MKIYNKKKRAESRVSYFSFLRWKEKKSSTFLLHLQFLRAYQASSREVKMKLRQFHSRFNWISECLKLIDDESDCNETRSSQLIIPKQGGAKQISRDTQWQVWKIAKLQLIHYLSAYCTVVCYAVLGIVDRLAQYECSCDLPTERNDERERATTKRNNKKFN